MDGIRKAILGLTLLTLVLAHSATQVFAHDVKLREWNDAAPSYYLTAQQLRFKEDESIWRDVTGWWFGYFTFGIKASRNRDDLTFFALKKYDDQRVVATIGVQRIADAMRWTMVLNGQTYTNLTANADLHRWHKVYIYCVIAFGTDVSLTVDGQLIFDVQGHFEEDLSVPTVFGIGVMSGNPALLTLTDVYIHFCAE